MLKNTTINIKNLHTVHANINKISPHPDLVKIAAVTKTLSCKAIESAYKNNLLIVGENKIQETIQKTKQFKKPKNLKTTNKYHNCCQIYKLIIFFFLNLKSTLDLTATRIRIFKIS